MFLSFLSHPTIQRPIHAAGSSRSCLQDCGRQTPQQQPYPVSIATIFFSQHELTPTSHKHLHHTRPRPTVQYKLHYMPLISSNKFQVEAYVGSPPFLWGAPQSLCPHPLALNAYGGGGGGRRMVQPPVPIPSQQHKQLLGIKAEARLPPLAGPAPNRSLAALVDHHFPCAQAQQLLLPTITWPHAPLGYTHKIPPAASAVCGAQSSTWLPCHASSAFGRTSVSTLHHCTNA